MNSEILDRSPPAAPESELALLAGFIVRGRVDPDCDLRADQFYDPRNAAIYSVMVELEGEAGQWDDLALIGRLHSDPLWGRDGLDSAYFGEVAHSAGNPAIGPYHSRQIKEAWRRRIVRQEAEQLLQLSSNGFAPDAMQAVLGRIAKAVSDAAGDSRVRPLAKIQDVCELCQRDIPQPPELIQGILHQGSKLSFGGASKAYKTWTLDYLALAAAYGLPWLGCETRQSRVLLIDLELQEAFCRKRLMKLADALNIRQEPGHLDVWNLRGFAVGHQLLLPQIEERIADHGYGLVNIDPIYKLYGEGSSENAAADIASLMNGLERVCMSTGAAMCFGAHFSKGNQAGKEAIDRVSGSGVFARDPDSLLTLTAHEEPECYTLEASLRNFPPINPFVVRWNFPLFQRDESLDPGALKKIGRKTTFTPEGLLSVLSDGMTAAEWQRAAGIGSHHTMTPLREKLVSVGKVKQEGQKWYVWQ